MQKRTYNVGRSNGFPTTGHFIALINRAKSTVLKSGRKNWVLFCIPSWLHVLRRCQDFLQIYQEKVSSCTNWCCFHWYNRFATLRAPGRGKGAHTATLALRCTWNKEAHNFGIQDLLACQEYHEGHWLFLSAPSYPIYIYTNSASSCVCLLRLFFKFLQVFKGKLDFSFSSRLAATVRCGNSWMQTTATAIHMQRTVRPFDSNSSLIWIWHALWPE